MREDGLAAGGAKSSACVKRKQGVVIAVVHGDGADAEQELARWTAGQDVCEHLAEDLWLLVDCGLWMRSSPR